MFLRCPVASATDPHLHSESLNDVESREIREWNTEAWKIRTELLIVGAIASCFLCVSSLDLNNHWGNYEQHHARRLKRVSDGSISIVRNNSSAVQLLMDE